jgi:HPt (histidine-containing phosphotransfer) domain-containing protein
MVENGHIIRSAPKVHFDEALFGEDPEFLVEIVNLFLATCPDLLSGIENAVVRRDAEALCRSAHTLKGAVANFGAQSVVDQAKELEMMGRSGDISHSEQAWSSLRGLMDALLPELEAEIGRVKERQVAT